MWYRFLKQWNGVSLFYDPNQTISCDMELCTDASLIGFGGIFKTQWFFSIWSITIPSVKDDDISLAFHRGSYMSAHGLLNLLNELGKSDKMRGLPSILSLFRNEFNKFNNTRARMLNSIYHMTNTLKSYFGCKNVMILSLCTQRCYGRHNVSRKSINH